ncbi:MAG: 2-C-methyl-D-erythritol 2,4-cyclodiphosphate synthase [Acidobacteriota bacterium]
MFRIGIGQDTHRLVAGPPLILGGVRIAFEWGAEGHSDSDALAHALIDALLGAMSDGDIGSHFPDSNPKWKDADSFDMLAHVMKRVEARGFYVVNSDATVMLERPKLREYIGSMRVNVARALNVDVQCVSVKAKTGEGLDAVGRGEAVSAIAVVLLMSRES